MNDVSVEIRKQLLELVKNISESQSPVSIKVNLLNQIAEINEKIK